MAESSIPIPKVSSPEAYLQMGNWSLSDTWLVSETQPLYHKITIRLSRHMPIVSQLRVAQ